MRRSTRRESKTKFAGLSYKGFGIILNKEEITKGFIAMIPLRKTDKENLSAEERAEIEAAWGEESERRMAELEAGKTESIPSLACS